MSILVMTGALYAMNGYLLGYINSISDEVLNSKKSAVLIMRRNDKIGEVRQNYNEIERKIGVISGMFVKKDYEAVGEMFMDIENTAKKHDIILSKSPAAKAEEPVSTSISAAFFNMTAVGDFDNIMKFLLYLDNFKYYLDLNNIEITSMGAGENNISKITLSGEMEVYLDNKKQP